MEKVISKDGTPIAYHRQGSGPPLILVHGAGSIAKRWFHLIPALEKNFSVFAVERRGRGESGDHQTYGFEREVEDILAVVDTNDQPVNLFGHSFGAFLTLEAALLTEKISKLMLYEPPIPLSDSKILPDGLMDDYEILINHEKNEEALIMFYSRVGFSANEIKLMQSTPEWQERVASAHTILRESRFTEQYTFNQVRYSDIQVQALLIVGSDSPPWAMASTETLNRALPNSSIQVLQGQTHVAMVTAPDLFVDVLTQFFSE